MTIKVLDVVGGELAEQAWAVYSEAFAEVNALAMQRHLMHRAEFDEVMADPRVDKFLALDDAGVLVAVSSFTNDLDAVSLIAPQYVQRRWPQHYAQRRIWYIGFVGVSPAARGTSAFVETFAEMYRVAEAADGLVALDICQFNEDTHRLPQTISLLLRRSSGGRSSTLLADAQKFWVFDMRGTTLQGSTR